MILPHFAVTQCGYMNKEYQCSRKLQFRHYYLILFLQVTLSHTPHLRVLEVHINGIRGITIHITETKIHISYSENHDSILMLSSIVFTCHPFQPLSISLLRVGNTFLISFNVTKLQKIVLMSWLAAFHSQCQWTRTHILIPYHPYGDRDSTWI